MLILLNVDYKLVSGVEGGFIFDDDKPFSCTENILVIFMHQVIIVALQIHYLVRSYVSLKVQESERSKLFNTYYSVPLYLDENNAVGSQNINNVLGGDNEAIAFQNQNYYAQLPQSYSLNQPEINYLPEDQQYASERQGYRRLDDQL